MNISASPSGARALLALGAPVQALGRALSMDKGQLEWGGREGRQGAVERDGASEGSAAGRQEQSEKSTGSALSPGARLEEGRRLLQSLNVMLLANLTQLEGGAAALLNTDTVRTISAATCVA